MADLEAGNVGSVAEQKEAGNDSHSSSVASSTNNPMGSAEAPKEKGAQRRGIGAIFRDVRRLVSTTTEFVEAGTRHQFDRFKGLDPEEQKTKHQELKKKKDDLEEACRKLKMESDFLQRNIDAILAENADLLFERRRLNTEVRDLDRSIDLSTAQLTSLKRTVTEARRRYMKSKKEGKNKNSGKGRNDSNRSLFSEQKSLKYGQSLQSRLKTDGLQKAMADRERLLKAENETLRQASTTVKKVSEGCASLQKAIEKGMASQDMLLNIQKELHQNVEQMLAREKALMDRKKSEQLDKLKAKLERAESNQNWIICSLSSGWCFAILIIVVLWGTAAALFKVIFII